MYRGEKPLMTKLAPTFSLEEVADHAIDFWLSTEDLPLAENRVSLDGDGNVTLSYKSTNDGARDRLFEQLRSLLGHLGMHEHHLIPRWAYLENKIPVAGVAHQAGTCRFGIGPRDLGAGHRLPGARARQPVRRRHELLPEHRGGQPRAHGDGQRGARRRPPAGAPGRQWRLRRRPAAGAEW